MIMGTSNRMLPSLGRAATRAALACACAAWAFVDAAHAMQEVATPPQPDRNMGTVNPVGGYALIAIAAAAVVLVNLMPAKRGHQD
jgi:hypothetical protein